MKRSDSIAVAAIRQVALLLGVLAVIWGAIGFHLRLEYQHALRNAETRTVSLARSFEATAGRSIAILDQTLEHVRDLYLRDPDHFTLRDWLRDKPVSHGINARFAVADATGLIVASTTADAPSNVNIADQDCFRAQVEATRDELFIGQPVIGRVSDQLSVPFTRRMTTPDGRFAGVVIASLDPGSTGVFDVSDSAGEGFMMLIGRDGIIRAAWPDTAKVGGSVLPATNPEMARMAEATSSSDGAETAVSQEAIASYRAVAGYPVFVAAGVASRAAFAPYARARLDGVLAGALLSLVVMVVGWTLFQRRQRLARSHRDLTLALENVSQGILMIDPNRRVPVINRRAVELLDLPEELAGPGADFDRLVQWQKEHGEFPAEPAADQRGAETVSENEMDGGLALYERTRPNGTALEIRSAVLPDGSVVRTFTDITARKRIERALAGARDAAEAGVRARTEFLAVMSREIRTPMNGIIGAAGLLRDMGLDDEQLEYVRVIRESGDHLSSLVQNILDFSLLDAGRLELEDIAFDPRALIEGTVATLGGRARAKGLTLVARIAGDLPVSVSGDPARLRQILVNLIGNAIRFTAFGGITVEARLIESDARTNTIGIAVTDSGVGIDPVSKQKLFSAFTETDRSMSRRFGGTGLGLAICAHLVALMGGTIDVDSSPGQGSTFQFSIRQRRVRADQPMESGDQALAKPVRHLKVLLAEDNPTNRHVATRMLTRLGHEVDAVEDGAQAVSAASKADYDVIIMDMMMPEVDGLAATRTIRAGTPPRCDTVIVGLTANALPSDRTACAEAGMNDFVTKPVTLERLHAALEQNVARNLTAADRPRASSAVTLDAAFLRQLADEISPDGVAEMVRIFLEDAPAHMAAIRRGKAESAVLMIRREAHALAGAACSVGLTRLSETAMALQHASEGAGPDGAAIEAVAEALSDSLPLATAWAEAHEGLARSGA